MSQLVSPVLSPGHFVIYPRRVTSRLRALLVLAVVASTVVGLGGFRLAAAQVESPTFTAQEAQAYKAWYDANGAADFPRAMDLAREYLKAYPAGRYAAYLTAWLPQARARLFGQAVQARDVDTMLRLGEEGLGDNPEDLYYLYWLAVGLRSAELQSTPPRATHETELVEFVRRALTLIEAGRVPPGIESSRWNQKAAAGDLYETLALVEEGHERWAKAAEYAEKAATLDATSPNHVFDCGRMHQASYLQAVRDLQAVPDTDRLTQPLKPQVQTLVDRVNREADAVIDCWTRFLALTAVDNPYGSTRGNVEKALAELYKYRHPDDPAGLQKAIDARRGGAPAAAPADAPAATKSTP